jgi:hypothetical protein
MIPAVQDDMEGCPDKDSNILFMILSALLGMIVFWIYDLVKSLIQSYEKSKVHSNQNNRMDKDLRDLQTELYGEGYLACYDKLLADFEDTRSSDEDLQASS